MATLVTGITPQDALRDGVTEAEAFARIFGNGAPGNLHPGLQLAALRRRVRPPRPVPQLPRSLRTRVARRQLALGPARRDAAGPRAAARRHRMAEARGRRDLVPPRDRKSVV